MRRFPHIIRTALAAATCGLGLAPTWGQSGWVVFTTKNSGLPSDELCGMTFDSKGRAWIGTTRGFVVFDGTTWTNGKELGFPAGKGEALVLDLCFDQSGRLWVASQGLLSYEGTEWQWYRAGLSPLPVDWVLCLATFGRATLGAGTVWVGTYRGLVELHDGRWTVYTTANSELPGNEIDCLEIAPDRRLWAGVFEHGLVRHEGGNRFTQYDLPRSSPFSGNSAWDIAFDQRGHLWAATRAGLAHFDGSTWRIYSVYNSPIPDNYLQCVEVDAEGAVWFGTHYAGLGRLKGQQWTVWDTTNSPLPENWVVSLAIDRWGNKWIGTWSKGLAIFREGGVILGVERQEPSRGLQHLALAQNYPNPFNSSTRIQFTLVQTTEVELGIYDLQGRLVATLLSGTRAAGTYTVSWDARDQEGRPLPSGIYACQLRVGDQLARVKMALVR